jgi:hypothetical protein
MPCLGGFAKYISALVVYGIGERWRFTRRFGIGERWRFTRRLDRGKILLLRHGDLRWAPARRPSGTHFVRVEK